MICRESRWLSFYPGCLFGSDWGPLNQYQLSSWVVALRLCRVHLSVVGPRTRLLGRPGIYARRVRTHAWVADVLDCPGARRRSRRFATSAPCLWALSCPVSPGATGPGPLNAGGAFRLRVRCRALPYRSSGPGSHVPSGGSLLARALSRARSSRSGWLPAPRRLPCHVGVPQPSDPVLVRVAAVRVYRRGPSPGPGPRSGCPHLGS